LLATSIVFREVYYQPPSSGSTLPLNYAFPSEPLRDAYQSYDYFPSTQTIQEGSFQSASQCHTDTTSSIRKPGGYWFNESVKINGETPLKNDHNSNNYPTLEYAHSSTTTQAITGRNQKADSARKKAAHNENK